MLGVGKLVQKRLVRMAFRPRKSGKAVCAHLGLGVPCAQGNQLQAPKG
jgi:hypothetical protein